MSNFQETIFERFQTYHENNPDQRFWQAVRNFSKYNFIFGKQSLDDKGEDTFYNED